MKRVKFVWDIYIKDNYIVIDLNGGCNSMIDTNYPETLEANKALKKNEIEFWATVNKSTINGLELLS